MPPTDHGPAPYVVDIELATIGNETFRTAQWTGEFLQLTLMHIPVGGEVGLEQHTGTDQFLRVEAGRARVQMGPAPDALDFDEEVEDDWAIFVPTSWWHNITNVGEEPLKLYSIYAPAHHPAGTIHATKAEADAVEEAEGH